MGKLEELEIGEKKLYRDGFVSGDYDQTLYLKRSVDDETKRPKVFLGAYSNINGRLQRQGYLYFYLDEDKKISYFIGIKVEPEYRNLNIASFLVASWIDLCMNNGYEMLGVNYKQKKPFLIYLLKTYGFEVLDKSQYETRPDVITICRRKDIEDKEKLLLFRDKHHEKSFIGTNVFKEDNYEIIHSKEGVIILDDIILPLQGMKKNPANYELLDYVLAESKVEKTISKHSK